MEIKHLALVMTVFGVTIYGAHEKPAKLTNWIANFTSDDVVGSWSAVAVAARESTRNQSHLCLNYTISSDVPKSVMITNFTLDAYISYRMPLDGFKEMYLLVAENYFVRKFDEVIAVRQGYTPTESLFIGILNDINDTNYGTSLPPVTHIQDLCTADRNRPLNRKLIG